MPSLRRCVSPCNHQDTVYVHIPFSPSSRWGNNSLCLLIFLMLLQLVSCRSLSQPFSGYHRPYLPQRWLWSMTISSLLAQSPRQQHHRKGPSCPITAKHSAKRQACRQTAKLAWVTLISGAWNLILKVQGCYWWVVTAGAFCQLQLWPDNRGEGSACLSWARENSGKDFCER